MDNVHKGHRERVKRRFIKSGLDDFEDHQVLELLLFFSIPYKDVNTIAHELLDKYGSLWGVFEAGYEELKLNKNIGLNTATLLCMIPSLAKRYEKSKWGDKTKINSTTEAGKYAVNLFIGNKYEVFYLISLDSKNNVNCADIINEGTIDETKVYLRILIESAIRNQAKSVILAHNHPGGTLKPSNADINLTKHIIKVLNEISIDVIDHIIVGGTNYYSFAENGFIS